MYVPLVKEQFLLKAILRFAIQETKRRKLLHSDKCHSHLTNSLMSHQTYVQRTDFFLHKPQGREYSRKTQQLLYVNVNVNVYVHGHSSEPPYSFTSIML